MGILQKNRPFFIFLLKFVLTYLVLSVIYWAYLSSYDAARFEPDGITRLVAQQSRYLVGLTEENAAIVPHATEASYRFLLNGKSMVRIVEGCNAVSVMILFTAFIIAFSGTLKKTSLYILAGIFIIHILNIARIAFLVLCVYYYPQYKGFMHDIFFPLFIYGVVFVLWVVWVTKFSGNAKRHPVK
jgi:exosortase family protein XrtF